MHKRPRTQKPRIHPLAHLLRKSIAEIEWEQFEPDAPGENPFPTWWALAKNVLEVLFDLAPPGLPSSKMTEFKETNSGQLQLATTRGHLVQFVDQIDTLFLRKEIFMPHFCPDSCPALLPPSRSFASCEVEATAPTTTPRFFADSSVATDPVITQSPTPPPPLPPLPSAPLPKRSHRVSHHPKASVSADPVRYVVRFGGKAPVALRSLPPTEPFRLSSLALSLSSAPHSPLLAAYWNRSDNLILAFPAGTPDLVVQPLLASIRSALHIDPAIPIFRVVRWSKVLISSVPARDHPDSPTFSEEAVAAALAANPSFSALSVVRAPRWVRNPASITKPTSSVSVSFEDPDGSVSRNLLKMRLFAFGAPLTVKHWIDKPGINAGHAFKRPSTVKTK